MSSDEVEPVLDILRSRISVHAARQMRQFRMPPATSLAASVSLIGNRNRDVLQSLLKQSVSETLRAGQLNRRQTYAVIDYAQFAMSHLRLPSRRMLFNDVFFHLKRSGELERHPLRIEVTDKEFAKNYIARAVGGDYNVSTVAILHNDSEIDSFNFPATCVIKPTHSCKDVIIRRGGEEIDRGKIKAWLRKNFYYISREANYRTLVPKIIVEPIVFGGRPHIEYKAFCWNGRPGLFFSQTGRGAARRRAFYGPDWSELPFSLGVPKADPPLPPPARAHDIARLAARLSAPFSIIRVDFYTNGEDLLVGELTNCHASATQAFVPIAAERAASRILFGGG